MSQRGSRLAPVLAGVGLLLVGRLACAALPRREVEATVARVADGDTLTAETKDGTRLKVRLFGIDAPELERVNRQTGAVSKPGQPYGAQARHVLDDLLRGRQVRLAISGADRYRCLLAIVFLGTVNVNLALVQVGLAEVDRGKADAPPALQAALEQAEQEARQRGYGMWRLGGQYESPRAFRARHRIADE